LEADSAGGRAAAGAAAAAECPAAEALSEAGKYTMSEQFVKILLVEESPETAGIIRESLEKFDKAVFMVHWVQSGEEALRKIDEQPDFDVIVTDYYMAGMNGLDFTRIVLKEKKIDIPVVFLTTNKDMEIVIKIMKLGVKDYLFKESVGSPAFPQAILSQAAKNRLKKEVNELEVKQRRLDAMQEIVLQISDEISSPLESMKSIAGELMAGDQSEKAQKYLQIMKENVERMEMKLEKLKNLKDDKTIQYIKDIRMIDLS
jgi:CheY-like chemotaxis protein